jgi:hypothetical protein
VRKAEKEKRLGCTKKFMSEYAIQCMLCRLWIHKNCSGFRFIDQQQKTTTSTAYVHSLHTMNESIVKADGREERHGRKKC